MKQYGVQKEWRGSEFGISLEYVHNSESNQSLDKRQGWDLLQNMDQRSSCISHHTKRKKIGNMYYEDSINQHTASQLLLTVIGNTTPFDNQLRKIIIAYSISNNFQFTSYKN